MHGNKDSGGDAAQVVDDPMHPGGGGGTQMHAADHGMDGAVAGQGLDVFEDMDDTRVGAAEDDDGALGRIEVKRLVVKQGILSASEGDPEIDPTEGGITKLRDDDAMEAFRLLCRTEGIIPAIESSHALAGAMQIGRELGPEGVVLVSLSGRGDKDVDTAARWFGLLEDPAGDESAGDAR